MTRTLATVALVALGFAVPAAWAGDVAAGEAAASTCIACHGERGVVPVANYPIIGGQHEDYLLVSMRAYKSGERSNAVMAQLMAELSDEDLQNLAAYFAAQDSRLK